MEEDARRGASRMRICRARTRCDMRAARLFTAGARYMARARVRVMSAKGARARRRRDCVIMLQSRDIRAPYAAMICYICARYANAMFEPHCCCLLRCCRRCRYATMSLRVVNTICVINNNNNIIIISSSLNKVIINLLIFSAGCIDRLYWSFSSIPQHSHSHHLATH